MVISSARWTGSAAVPKHPVMAAALIRAVECAYELHGDTAEWLLRLGGALERVTPLSSGATACVAWTFDLAQRGVVEDVVLLRGDPRLPFIVRQSNHAARADAEGPGVYGFQLGFQSTLASVAQAVPETLEVARAALGAVGAADFVLLNAVDADFRGAVIGWTVPEELSLSNHPRYARLAAHVAAGRRLKTSLEEVEAVLAPDGRLLHAEVPAQGAREKLREAARAIDRARLAGTDPDEALELWIGLVDGRWSLVDRFESDGRRFLVACRNDPRRTDPRALTATERAVLPYAAMGHPNKVIAYELGLSETAVANHVASVVQKLGLPSRAALASVLTSLFPHPA
jgi:DNA-binding CsgD family transcriptional regulator